MHQSNSDAKGAPCALPRVSGGGRLPWHCASCEIVERSVSQVRFVSRVRLRLLFVVVCWCTGRYDELIGLRREVREFARAGGERLKGGTKTNRMNR